MEVMFISNDDPNPALKEKVDEVIESVWRKVRAGLAFNAERLRHKR